MRSYKDHTPESTSPPEASTGMKRVRGVFHSRDALTRAVRGLAEKSVPTDSISVHVLDEEGNHRRQVRIEREAGALRGALIGAAAGATLGVIIVVLLTSGALGSVGIDLLSVESVVGALRTIATTAVAAMPLGALIGMGNWRAKAEISAVELQDGAAEVVVESDVLADTARSVLFESGAESVSG